MPCSTCCITAVQVNSLEIEPGRNSVVRGSTRRAFGNIGEPIAALGEDLTVLDDDDDGSRNVTATKRVRHEAVQPGVHVGCRKSGPVRLARSDVPAGLGRLDGRERT